MFGVLAALSVGSLDAPRTSHPDLQTLTQFSAAVVEFNAQVNNGGHVSTVWYMWGYEKVVGGLIYRESFFLFSRLFSVENMKFCSTRLKNKDETTFWTGLASSIYQGI